MTQTEPLTAALLRQLSPRGQEVLRNIPAVAGPERLHAERLDLDAVRLLACTLPARRAVWWGCLCAWHARGAAAPAQAQALTAAVEWVVRPTASASTAALTAAGAAGLDNAAGCIARAAAAAGPDPSPKPAVELTLAARAVQGAALYAHLQRQKMEPGFTYRQVAALGLQVARGEVLWESP